MKKKHGFLLAARLFLRRIWALLIFAVAISNFVLSCTATRSLKTQYVYNVVTNEILRSSVVTQFLSSTSSISSSSSPSSVPEYFPPVDHPTSHYSYMILNRRKAVMLFDRLHFIGSRTSYGRIVEIFPDRVILDNGDTISNSNLNKGTSNGSSTVQSTPIGIRPNP